MLQGVDHVLNTLVVTDEVCIAVVDDGANPGVDDLFQILTAALHPVSYQSVSIYGGVHAVVARTGEKEIDIDNVARGSPGCLGTNCSGLTIQPLSDVGRIIRGITIKDVVVVPWAAKGSEDVVAAVVLGLATVRVCPGSGAFEYLGSSW